ncbi:energy-coupling factor ABC transporter permease [Kutzneria kofuensis]|uniref:energy-coupling factor ABC transporter permease n=1 Tax=Kutzneria kofuensis TaxID=103725 RepID=UPI0031E5A046
MHIPDGFVNAPVSIAGGVVAVAGLALCSRNLGPSLRDRDIPLAGLAAAFFLVLEAPIFPIGWAREVICWAERWRWHCWDPGSDRW